MESKTAPSNLNNGLRQQKNVVKTHAEFKKTELKLFGGNSRPTVAHKVTKTPGVSKQFALKDFGDEEGCAEDKLRYDLLQLCGVKVPKTYILENDEGKLTILASKIEPGYKDLLFWAGGNFDKERYIAFWGTDQQNTFSSQRVLAKHTKNKQQDKPIIGLYENPAVFAFMQDSDAVGGTYQNIGLVEHDDYFQTIKIDPTCSEIYPGLNNSDDMYALNVFLLQLTTEKCGGFWGGGNINIFQHSTRKQINDGMRRVAELSDEQLHTVIYNQKIPYASLPKEKRDEIYQIFVKRRDVFRSAYKQLTARKHLFWGAVAGSVVASGLGIGAGAASSLHDSKIVIGSLGTGAGLAFLLSCIVLWKLKQARNDSYLDPLIPKTSGDKSIKQSEGDFSSVCFCMVAVTTGLGVGAGTVATFRVGKNPMIISLAVAACLAFLLSLSVALWELRKAKKIADSETEESSEEERPSEEEYLNSLVEESQKQPKCDFGLACVYMTLISIIAPLITDAIVQQACGLKIFGSRV